MLNEKLMVKEITEMSKKGYTDFDMSIELGCSPSTIAYYRSKYNIEKVRNKKRIVVDEERVLDLYHNEGLSISVIAKRMGCSYAPIKRIIDKSKGETNNNEQK